MGSLDAVDDLLDGLDRFVGQRLALVTGGVDLYVSGLAIRTLCARGGQRIAPEILDVLDVLGVGLELGDDLVVVLVRIVAERLFAFEHDHDRAVGLELLEHLADALHRDHRRRVVGVMDTERIFPTSSSWGTMTFSTPMTAIQPMMIGTDRRRIHLAIPPWLLCFGAEATGIESVGVS